VGDISSRNQTADWITRVEAGKPLDRPWWVSGPAIEAVLREVSADAGLLDELAAIRGQIAEPRQ
jgi:hypothetical protein